MRRVAIATCSIVLMLTVGVGTAAADVWSQWRYDQIGSGVNPSQAPIDAGRWRVRWSKLETESRHFTTAPVITEDRLYVGGYIGDPSRPQVWCFDLATGHVRWVTHFRYGVIRGGAIAVIDGIVALYYGAPPGIDDPRPEAVRYLDADTGFKRASAQGTFGAPTITEDQLLYMGTARFIYQHGIGGGSALNDEVVLSMHSLDVAPMPITSGVGWVSDSLPPTIADRIALVHPGVTQSLSLATGTLAPTLTCVGSESVCAIDIATGELLWTAAMGGDPTVADGVVYHLCDQEGNAICARSLATGDLLWKSADVAHLGGAAPALPAGTGEAGGPIMGGGVLFANVWDSSLQQWTTAGIDPATGRLLTFRRHDIFGPNGGWYSAIANGYLVSTVPNVRVVSFDR